MSSLSDRFNELRSANDFAYVDMQLQYIIGRIGIDAILDKIGVEFDRGQTGRYVYGFCPDHYEFTGRYPSHPKWSVDSETGHTYCWTESRASNLLEVTKRVMNFQSIKQAADYLLGDEKLPTCMELRRIESSKPRQQEPECVPEHNDSLNAVREIVDSGEYDSMAVSFFAKNGITEDTMHRFHVASVGSGFLKERALIPFYDCHERDRLVGYVAVDVNGKRQYVRKKVREYIRFSGISRFSDIRKAYETCLQRYKKALFCDNAPTASHLFGLSTLSCDELVYAVLVEGERDVMKLQQEGFNALGTHGTHLTQQQKKLLHEFGARRIYICFDGDRPGIEAAERVYSSIRTDFESVSIVRLPAEKDNPKMYSREEFLPFLRDEFSGKSNYWGSKVNNGRQNGILSRLKGKASR